MVEDDDVTFDLNGHTYALTNTFVAAALGTVPGRSGNLKIIDGTPITKNGETATIDDNNKDDEVSASYQKDSDGTLLARTVKIGPIKHKATPTPTASPKR